MTELTIPFSIRIASEITSLEVENESCRAHIAEFLSFCTMVTNLQSNQTGPAYSLPGVISDARSPLAKDEQAEELEQARC